MPADTSVTVDPATVHTAGVVELKLTANPELADAIRSNGAVPGATELNGAKVIVCDVVAVVLAAPSIKNARR